MFTDTLVTFAKTVKTCFSSQDRHVSDTVFSDPISSASELLIALKRTLGPNAIRFEPETIWLSLDVEPVNRDQLLAAITVVLTTDFWNDYRVFGNTALAFGDHAVVVDTVPNPDPRDMAWAVFEAEVLASLWENHEPFFDDEVATYVATVLHQAGFVVAPDFLEFAQDALNQLTSRDFPFSIIEIQTAWDAIKDLNLEKVSFDGDAKGVQLARLAEVRLYLVKRASALITQLQGLTS